MGYQAIFKRYELKYLITADQKEKILKAMQPYMIIDKYGRSTVRNIYFDTEDFVLARHSIAKPDFKEKLRIRSYSKADENSLVFVELKRKFDHIVYKRRVGLSEKEAMKWASGGNTETTENSKMTDKNEISKKAVKNGETENTQTVEKVGQIEKSNTTGDAQLSNEIDYFIDLYGGLRPALYLSYDREAYRMRSGNMATAGEADFRVTFDSNILCRESDLSLTSEAYGTPLLQEGKFLMELKCSGGIPMWMTKILSEEHIYKTSFSKYGTAYCGFMRETPAERAHIIAAESLASLNAANAARWESNTLHQQGNTARQERNTLHQQRDTGRHESNTLHQQETTESRNRKAAAKKKRFPSKRFAIPGHASA